MQRLACVFLLALAAAFGQIGTSTLTGRVTDPTGAVVPGVAVTVVQVGTNFTFKAVTNSEGLYRVLSLQPGMYRLTFESAGFRRLVRENVELRTSDTLAIDAALEVGNVAVFLASEMSRSVTGDTIYADNGVNIIGVTE